MFINLHELILKYKILPTGVLHIGAHWAEEAEEYYINGMERTIWVEANPECLSIMENTLKKYSNFMIFIECLTDKNDEDVEFNISNYEGQSSSILELEYHKIAHPYIRYIDKINLKTKRLDKLLVENNVGIKDYQFVNIDLQGAELLALKGFGELLFQVKYLYLEVNEKQLYKHCPLVNEVDEYVKQFGFDKKEQIMCGDFGWGDAFYVNRFLIS